MAKRVSLKGKGADLFFGEGMARRFAAEGAAIVVNDLNEDGGHRVVADILRHGGRATVAATWDPDSLARPIRARRPRFVGLLPELPGSVACRGSRVQRVPCD